MVEADYSHLVSKTFEEVGYREASSTPMIEGDMMKGDGFIALESTLADVEELVHSRGFNLLEFLQERPKGLVEQAFLVRGSVGYQGSNIAVYVIEGRVWITNYDYGHFNRVLVNGEGSVE